MKIVFLDLDGVMIPSYQYLIAGMKCSYERKFAQPAMVCLKHLLSLDPKIKIIFNTMHNTDGKALIDDAVREGIPRNRIHRHKHSGYPQLYRQRIHAIEATLQDIGFDEEEGHKWSALDDERIPHDYAVYVDPDSGLNLSHIEQCARILDTKKRPQLILM